MRPERRRAPALASIRSAFRTIIWPRRGRIAVGLFLILVNRLCALVLPGSTRVLLDQVIPNEDMVLLGRLLGVVGGAIILQAISSFLLTRFVAIEAQHLISQLRCQVQKHVIQLPISYFDSTKAGVLVSRIISDVEGVRNLVGTGLVQLIGGCITALAQDFNDPVVGALCAARPSRTPKQILPSRCSPTGRRPCSRTPPR